MAEFETDEEIIQAFKEGDKEKFGILVERYTSPLFNFTARLSNRNDASDIVQESFIKIWKNIHRFDQSKASFKTWIFTIAKNTTTDFLRKKKSILFVDMEKETDDTAASFAENIPDEGLLPDGALQKLQDADFLNTILEKLRMEYREVLILHYQEEMTFEEIGKILGKPLNTVKSQHRRAILELRRLLDFPAPN
jgi:RNA polymerase sigma-70 factor (ECF subfamily)